MIIYAYYGSGKTTLVNQCPELFTEIDAEHCWNISVEDIIKQIHELDKDHIVFINGYLYKLPTVSVDMAFIPESIDIPLKRLQNRNVDASFLTFIQESFSDCKQDVINMIPNHIYYDENTFLSDYHHYFETLYQERKKTYAKQNERISRQNQ